MPTKGKHNQSSRCDGGSSTIIVPPLPPPSKSPATSRQLRLPLPTSSAALSLSSTIEDGGALFQSSSQHIIYAYTSAARDIFHGKCPPCCRATASDGAPVGDRVVSIRTTPAAKEKRTKQ
ncbi:hypothetical protein QTG54_013870 [Skeletonema marinoi]|uniref:Uncharacterized protein n=1 Tax=Skeletonema marinoi TaxID=267567 RepID=A0AAD8XXS5_9STRA|nr:hypothetical protein QTG54_013870 [Skeletonema marinoi]